MGSPFLPPWQGQAPLGYRPAGAVRLSPGNVGPLLGFTYGMTQADLQFRRSFWHLWGE